MSANTNYKAKPDCPACRMPFIDDEGKFSICRNCPYRQVPEASLQSAHINNDESMEC